MKKSEIFVKYFPFLLFTLSLFFLLWNLGGDPSILKHLGDFADEGYWLQNPINKVKYNVFFTDDQSQSYFGAPLFNLLMTLQFKLFGVSYFNARIISVFFLISTSVVLFFIFKQKINDKNRILLYVAAFLMFFDNKIYYQWATPIPLEIFFQSIVILFVSKFKLSDIKNILILMLLVYLAILSKMTSIWLIGFAMILFVVDNMNLNNLKENKKLIYKIIFIVILFVIPYFLINTFFSVYTPEKYETFKQLLHRNIGINKLFMKNFLNPLYYINGLIQAIKYNNSFFLLLFPFVAAILVPSKFYINIFDKKNRLELVTLVYIISFIGFLILINQFVSARREINLILPLYILAILSFEYIIKMNKKIKWQQTFIFIFYFLIISVIQFGYLLNQLSNQHIITFLKNIDKIYVIILMVYISIFFLYVSYLLFKKKFQDIFYFFIFINVLFNVIFINNNNTIQQGSDRIDNIAQRYNIKYSTGPFAHLLAVDTDVIPIWWLDKSADYPNWNYNFNLFTKEQPVIIITCEQVANKHYYQLENIPENYKIINTDTVYLFKKMFSQGYVDTLQLNVCAYEP